MKKIKLILSATFILGCFGLYAQVGIGTQTPQTNSILDITSSTKGVLLPRMTTAQRTTLGTALTTTPDVKDKGMQVYDTDTNSFWYWDGTIWAEIGGKNIYAADGTIATDRNVGVTTKLNFDANTFVIDGVNNNVGIGTNAPNSSALLELNSTNKGLLLPRMTNNEFKAIPNPVNGLTVYNTTFNCLMYYADGAYNCTHYKPASKAPTAPLGSSYTAHFNGITAGVSINSSLATYTTGETFNNNITCQNSPISAQGCGGLTQVTGASGTVYPLININGQCWMQTNLKEISNHFANYTHRSWLNTSASDLGYWGYYNVTTPDGSSGFGTVEPAPGEGYLYQWSAAMDNSEGERSRGICPAGFHIPSDCEWKYLEHGMGMSIVEQNVSDSWRANSNNNQGSPSSKLRSQGVGNTNASGFSWLLTGNRANHNGSFANRITGGYAWTSSAINTFSANLRSVNIGNLGVWSINVDKGIVFPVRCLKD
jgi:uncharacterized protein (TIGR02145 family)